MAFKIILTTLPLVFVLSQAPAQPCRQGSTAWPNCTLVEVAERVASKYCTIIPPTEQAKQETENIMNAYVISGENGLDNYLDKMDASWYKGIDVYLHDDRDETSDIISSDEQAEFRQNKSAMVTVAVEGEDFLIVIYSFP